MYDLSGPGGEQPSGRCSHHYRCENCGREQSAELRWVALAVSWIFALAILVLIALAAIGSIRWAWSLVF